LHPHLSAGGPLSRLTGIFGVNFCDIPATGHAWGFYVFVAMLFVLATLVLWLLRRRGLL